LDDGYALGFELARYWNQVWTNIKHWTADASAFIRRYWYLIISLPGRMAARPAGELAHRLEHHPVGDQRRVGVHTADLQRDQDARISPVQIAIDILDGHWSAALRHFAGVTSGTVRFLGPIFYGIRFVIDMVRAAIDLLTGHWSAAWQIMGGAVRAAVAPILATIKRDRERRARRCRRHLVRARRDRQCRQRGQHRRQLQLFGMLSSLRTRSPRTVATPQAGISAKAGTGSTERGSEWLFKTGSQVRVMSHGTGPAPASGGGTTIINQVRDRRQRVGCS
jgi:hypothetical protein